MILSRMPSRCRAAARPKIREPPTMNRADQKISSKVAGSSCFMSSVTERRVDREIPKSP